MEVHDTQQPAFFIAHRKGHYTMAFHAIRGFGRQHIGRDRLWIRVHRLGDQLVEEILSTVYEAGQIAGGEHTYDTPVAIQYLLTLG